MEIRGNNVTLDRAELVKILQAYFRRYVADVVIEGRVLHVVFAADTVQRESRARRVGAL